MVNPDQLLRSHSLAVGLAIPGFDSPVRFEIGGWMYGVGRRVKAGTRGLGVQGIAGKFGLGPAIQLAPVNRAGG
ncbi:MAG: hypothetical protein WCK53_13695 [Methanomicrobiales archaeon]